MEAPNSIKFQSTQNPNISTLHSSNQHIDIFQQLFNESISKYKHQQDYTPKSPKTQTMWLEYSNGHSDSIDDALGKLKNQNNPILVKFSSISKDNNKILNLFENLKHNKTVKHLVIKHSSLSIQHIKNIERILQLNDGIAWLVLDHNEIDDAGAKAIANGLSDNQTVQHVVLSDNLIKDEGAHHLSAMLKKNQKIETLFLNNNSISDSGALSIIDGLKSRPPLDIIDIRNNNISKKIKVDIQNLCHKLNTTCYS